MARLAPHAAGERLSSTPAATAATLEAVSSNAVPLTLGVAATGEGTDTTGARVGGGDGGRGWGWSGSRSRSRLVVWLGDEDAARVGLRGGRTRSRLGGRRRWLGNGDRSCACANGRTEDIGGTIELSNLVSRVGKLDIGAFCSCASIGNVGNEHVGQGVHEVARAT